MTDGTERVNTSRIGSGTRYERTDYDVIARTLAEKLRRADVAGRGGDFWVEGATPEGMPR